MADSVVQIKVQADVGDLQANMAKGESAFSKFSTTVNSTSSGLAAALNAADGQVVKFSDSAAGLRGQFDSQRSAIAEVDRQFKAGLIGSGEGAALVTRIKEAFAASATEAGGFGIATAGATREIIVLGHEMVSGNFTRIPGSLMVLAERMGGLSLSAMGAAGAVAALGYGLYELIEYLATVNTAIDQLGGTMAQMGNGAQFSAATARQAARDLADGYNVGTKAAIESMNAMEQVASATQANKAVLVDLAVAWVQMGAAGKASDDQVVKGVEAIRSAVAGGASSIRSFLAAHQLLTPEYAKELDGAQQFNDSLRAQGVLIEALKGRVGDYAQALRAFNTQQTGLVSFGETFALTPTDTKRPDPAKFGGAAANAGQLQDYQNQSQVVSQTREVIAQVTAQWTGAKAELDATVAQIWQNVVDQTKTGGKTLETLDQELLNARRQARQSAGQDAVGQERLTMSALQAAQGAGHAGILQAEIASSQRLLSNANLSADERRNIEIQLNGQLAQLRSQQASTALDAARQLVQDARAGSQQRIAAATEEAETARRLYGEDSAEYRRALNDKRAAERESARERQEIERQNADADVAIAKLELASNKQLLDDGVAEHAVTAQQKIEILRGLTEAAYQEDLQRLQDELATLDDTTKEYNRIYNEIRKLKAQHNQEMATLDRQAADETKKAADESARAWEQALSPASRAFDSMLSGIMMGTQTAQQAMARAGANMAASYLADIGKMIANFLAFKGLQEIGWTQMADSMASKTTKEAAAWMAGERTKTAATTEGNATRTASDAAGESSFLGRLGTMISGWLGLETGKTAATTAGVATRTAAEETGAAMTKTTEVTTAVSSIGTKAADAAAGAYDAMAAIPVVGPALGAAAAAATFAAVIAYQSIASAEGGWGQVPYDGALAMLHKNEMVLPANLAASVRAMSGTAQAAAAGATNTNNTWHLNAPMSVTSMNGPMSRSDFSTLLRNHGDLLIKHLQNAHRNGRLSK
jgi:hypothetical protein